MKIRSPCHRIEDSALLIMATLSLMTQLSTARSFNRDDTGSRPTNLSSTTESVSKPSITNKVNISRKDPDKVSDSDINVTRSNSNVSVSSELRSMPGRSEQELPYGLIISSPAVAVGVFIFICITYRIHSRQLDAQSKELAVSIEAGPSPNVSLPASPCRSTAQRLLVPGHAVSDSDLIGQRRKSLRTPTPPPLGLSSKRGSCLSALSDQEVLARASPRRHSTFIL